MTFPHEGFLITIDQLSYHDPPSHNSPIRSISSMVYVESMDYVSTNTIGVDPTPIKCEPIALVPPPHHLSLEVRQVQPLLGTLTTYASPISKINFVSSSIVSDAITYFYGLQYLVHHNHLTDCFVNPQNLVHHSRLIEYFVDPQHPIYHSHPIDYFFNPQHPFHHIYLTYFFYDPQHPPFKVIL